MATHNTDTRLGAAVAVLALAPAACNVTLEPEPTTSVSDVETAPTTLRVTPAPDVGQFNAQVERELADNPAYELMAAEFEDFEDAELVATDDVGFVYIGQTYCEAFQEGGREGAVIQLGYDVGLANDFGAILSQLRELDPTASDATASDLSDVYASAFYAADQWL